MFRWLESLCLTPLSTIFELYWWRKPMLPEENYQLKRIISTCSIREDL